MHVFKQEAMQDDARCMIRLVHLLHAPGKVASKESTPKTILTLVSEIGDHESRPSSHSDVCGEVGSKVLMSKADESK